MRDRQPGGPQAPADGERAYPLHRLDRAGYDGLTRAVVARDHDGLTSEQRLDIVGARGDTRHRPVAIAGLAHDAAALGGKAQQCRLVHGAGPMQAGQLTEAVPDSRRRLDAHEGKHAQARDRRGDDARLRCSSGDQVTVYRRRGRAVELANGLEPARDRAAVASLARSLAREQEPDAGRALGAAEEDALGNVESRTGAAVEHREQLGKAALRLLWRPGDDSRPDRPAAKLLLQGRGQIR